MAVLSLQVPGLPAYQELFRLHLDGGLLLFNPRMTVELKLAEGTQTTDAIMAGGLAASTEAGWRLPLVIGSRGAVRYGDLALLFKIRARREAPLKAVRQGLPTLCGTCGAPMPWAVVGFGALSPCGSCGTLNEVQIDSGAPEDRRTQMAPVIRRKSVDLPTFDSISVRQKSVDLPTFDSISVRRVPDAPTFDPIAVGKHADLPTFDAIAVLTEENLRLSAQEQSAATRRMPPEEQLSETRPPAPPAPSPPQPQFLGRGADLPTFDAISRFQEQGLTATAAVTALRGDGSTEAPPVSLTDAVSRPDLLLRGEDPTDPGLTLKAVTAPMRRPVPRYGGAPPELVTTDAAPPVHATDFVSIPDEAAPPPAPALVPQAVAEGERDFFGEEFLVNLEQQRSFVSVPILKQPSDLGSTPPPSYNGVPYGATPPPHGVGAAPVAREQLHGRQSGFLRSEAPAPRPPLPPLNGSGEDSGVIGFAGSGEEADGDGGDDFLMGRSDLPSPPSPTNRWLLMIGTVAGLSGVVLILYKLIVG